MERSPVGGGLSTANDLGWTGPVRGSDPGGGAMSETSGPGAATESDLAGGSPMMRSGPAGCGAVIDSGPVLLWSALPMELVLEGLSPAGPALRDVVVDGRLLQVEPGQDGLGTVVRLVSGRAQDYLDPRFQPGARVTMPAEG